MKTIRNILTAACILALPLSASAQDSTLVDGPFLDDTIPYRLVNAGFDRLGQTMCADIFNGGPSNNQINMQPCANYSGQMWHLSRVPIDLRHLPTYKMTTEFRGSEMCLSLDGTLMNHEMRLTPCVDWPTDNQLWIFYPVEDQGKVVGWQIMPLLDERENYGEGFSLVVSAPPEGDGVAHINKIDYVGAGYIWRLQPW